MAPVQNIEISVNALAAPDAAGADHSSYILASAQADITDGDLQFQEFSRYVERAFSAKGMKRTTDPDKADVVVLLSYGIGDPKTFQSSVAIPVWGPTGISSLNTTGRVIGNSFSSTTTVTPSYGIAGYSNIETSNTYYTRNARLVAFKKDELKKGGSNQLWKVSIVSTGSSGDLRFIFPFLMTAASPYIGKNPGRMVTVQLPVNDPSVAALAAH